jgi:hypothetical protein
MGQSPQTRPSTVGSQAPREQSWASWGLGDQTWHSSTLGVTNPVMARPMEDKTAGSKLCGWSLKARQAVGGKGLGGERPTEAKLAVEGKEGSSECRTLYLLCPFQNPCRLPSSKEKCDLETDRQTWMGPQGFCYAIFWRTPSDSDNDLGSHCCNNVLTMTSGHVVCLLPRKNARQAERHRHAHMVFFTDAEVWRTLKS